MMIAIITLATTTTNIALFAFINDDDCCCYFFFYIFACLEWCTCVPTGEKLSVCVFAKTAELYREGFVYMRFTSLASIWELGWDTSFFPGQGNGKNKKDNLPWRTNQTL
mmetsp:Transcript_16739/g.32559  ORF Transcript_16739/g.32559 Transcript_16739/m.32559 type:complete len:109 (+) Transcript_16739:829-1155(+)